MLAKLRDFIQGLGSRDFQQEQNEAMLTMLVWVMLADGKLAPGEDSKINDFLAVVNWKSETSPEDYIQNVTARIESIGSGTLTEDELMAECAGKLRGEDIRYKAVKISYELAKADNYFDQAEKHLLKLFSKTLT